MKKYLMSLLIMLALTSCSLIQKQEIEQGNVITPDMISKIHRGMSEMEVREIMGNPALINIFTPNRVDYVYTLKTGNNPRIEKRVSCIFANGRLKEMEVG